VSDGSDRQQIHDVLLRYCRSIDRCDELLCASTLYPDAVIERGTQVIDPVSGEVTEQVTGADWPKYALDTVKQASLATMHIISNHLIEVHGDVAASEAYFTRWQLCEAGSGRELRARWGRYVDRLERREGEWRIAHRQVVSEWSIVEPLGPDAAATGDPHGLRSRDDVSYRVLHEVMSSPLARPGIGDP
jgi:SnoaL-like domain